MDVANFKSDSWPLQLRRLTLNSHNKEEKKEKKAEQDNNSKDKNEGKKENENTSKQNVNMCVLCGMDDCKCAYRLYNLTVHSDSRLHTITLKRGEQN